jgi:L-ribulose-5-phosphate 3-epimerase
MKNKIGVMQGRLLPKYKKKYQAHPVGYWQEEFVIAQKIGLDCVEFILDFDGAEENPLLTKEGISQINKVVDETGVSVQTVCVDYLMEAPLHSENIVEVECSKQIMTRLFNNSSKLGITDLVIPCVDKSSLNSKGAIDRFVSQISPMVEIAEDKRINLSLETDMPPGPFLELLDYFDSKYVTVNYDIGNSAALGYDPVEELSAYGNRITDIHIKDRELYGDSVILGNGNANFDKFFKSLSKFNYQGLFIMQAYRDENGVDIFKKQLNWIDAYLRQL